MKIFKMILIVLAIIIAIPLLLALFIKKDYLIERQITVNKPQQQVFDYIKMIRNQDHYSVWNMSDPNKKTTSAGTDGTVGFVYSWNGNDKVGEGEQEIAAIAEGDSITCELRFKRPFKSTGIAGMSAVSASPRSTVVKWNMRGRSNYPMNIMNLMMDRMLGKDMEKSLANLKKILEEDNKP